MKTLFKLTLSSLFTFSLLFSMGAAAAEKSTEKSAEKITQKNAEVYFLTPNNGATVESPVTIKFGLKGMGVAPAGINADNTGHHHLLIDLETLPDMTKALPANDNVRHFGGGQTEVKLELSPGKHTLQLLLGDYGHKPHTTPVISEKITITVK